MIDVMTETLIDLPTTCGLPPLRNHKTGRPASLPSVYRYITRGSRAANGQRVRLETVRTPGGLRCSREAVERFIRALNEPDSQIPQPRSATRAKQIASAEQELHAAGFEL